MQGKKKLQLWKTSVRQKVNLRQNRRTFVVHE